MYVLYTCNHNVLREIQRAENSEDLRDEFERLRGMLPAHPGASVKVVRMINSVVSETLKEVSA